MVNEDCEGIEKQLVAQALHAKKHAAAQHSGFSVGAAIMSDDGTVFTGCNVESSSYGLSVCAERVALFKALSEGHQKFRALAVTTDLKDFCPPCGACRQVLWDYAPNLELYVANCDGEFKKFLLKDLFPEAFDTRFLQRRSRK